jgi:hypothetical protein
VTFVSLSDNCNNLVPSQKVLKMQVLGLLHRLSCYSSGVAVFNGAAVARRSTPDKSALPTVKSRRLENDNNRQDETV